MATINKKTSKKTGAPAAAKPKVDKVEEDPAKIAALLGEGYNGHTVPKGYEWSTRKGWVENGIRKATRRGT